MTQPFDAMGAVAEGGLLASLQVPWIAKRTAASAAVSLAAVIGAAHAGAGLLGLWVGAKLLNFGTLALDMQHLGAGSTPLEVVRVPGVSKAMPTGRGRRRSRAPRS